MLNREKIEADHKRLLDLYKAKYKYSENREDFEGFFNLCVRAYRLSFSQQERDKIREIALYWVERIAYDEDISVYVGLPYPSRDFGRREVPLSAVFERHCKRQLSETKRENADWRGAFEDYWKQFAEPHLHNFRSVFQKPCQMPVELGVSRFHDTGLLKAFWDIHPEMIASQVGIYLEPIVIGWERFDDDFKARKIKIGIHSFSPILRLYQKTRGRELLRYAYGLYELRGHSIHANVQFIARVIKEGKRKRKRAKVWDDLERLIDNPDHRLRPNSQRALLTTLKGESKMRLMCEWDTDHEAILRFFLSSHSVRPNTHYELKSCENSDESLKRFLAGELDLYLGGLQQTYYLEKGEEKEKARLIVPLGEFAEVEHIYPVNGFITRASFLQTQHLALGKLIWLWFVLTEILMAALKEFKKKGSKRSEAILLRIIDFLDHKDSELYLSDASHLVEMYKRNRFYATPDESKREITAAKPLWLRYWQTIMRGTSLNPEHIIPHRDIETLSNRVQSAL